MNNNINNANIYEPSSNFNNPRQHLPNATVVLILGIFSILGCLCFGIVGLVIGIIALVLAHKDRKRYNLHSGFYTESSYKNLTAGSVCALFGVILSLVNIIGIIITRFILGLDILDDLTQSLIF